MSQAEEDPGLQFPERPDPAPGPRGPSEIVVDPPAPDDVSDPPDERVEIVSEPSDAAR